MTSSVAALTVLALVLRWACVHQSLFGDELFLWNIVHHRSLGGVLTVVHDTEKTPPLGFVLSWITARGGDAAALVRLPSLVASVATVPLVFALGVGTVGRRAGLVAAAWFALSPFEIFYGTESRAYALVTAFVILSTLSLLLALDTRRVRWWVLYALAASAAVYSHYTAALVLVPQAAWALWTHRDRLREQLIAHGLVVLAFAPWIPSFLVQLRHSGDEARRIAAATPLTLANAVDTGGKPLIGHPYTPFGRVPGSVPLIVLGAVLAAALARVLSLRGGGIRRRDDGAPQRRANGLVTLLWVLPAAVVFAYSTQPHRSFLLARNLSVAVPFALLALGALLAGARARIAAALSMVAILVVAVGAVQMLRPRFQRPDTRAAARFVDRHASSRAVVVDLLLATSMSPYLQRPHRFYSGNAFGPAEQASARRERTPIVVVFTRLGFLRSGLGPSPYGPGYRLASDQVTPGAPGGIETSLYVPRRTG